MPFALIVPLPVGALAQNKHPPTTPVELNAARIEQLEQIPQVVASTAKSIVSVPEKNGPFREVDERLAIKSISQPELEKIRPYVAVTTHAWQTIPRCALRVAGRSKSCEAAIQLEDLMAGFGGDELERYLIDDFETETIQRDNFFRVVGEDANAAQT